MTRSQAYLTEDTSGLSCDTLISLVITRCIGKVKNFRVQRESIALFFLYSCPNLDRCRRSNVIRAGSFIGISRRPSTADKIKPAGIISDQREGRDFVFLCLISLALADKASPMPGASEIFYT
ncbi:hypothetical protein RRG08_034301 [Elysia crispata]|uniref:Uncharacterized protein n=1 Tax=Elysia crispata TaxID=231223 RepID=A0AAE1AGR6_9GAST|nr:hypothetical protein RRG08_034301 [Elysia crispata]